MAKAEPLTRPYRAGHRLGGTRCQTECLGSA
jgi:hypothetical protein